MLQSILVPLDGTKFSERTLTLAEDLARNSGAALHLAHVHVPHPPDHLIANTQFQYEGVDMADYDGRDQSRERDYLEEVVARLDPATVADSALLEGEVAERVAAYAEEVKADMVLVTTHGHVGLSRMWLGSVADRLLHRTHLPLLLVHPADAVGAPADIPTFEHILVALDGSERSASILPAVADLAQASGARITLVHVLQPSAVVGSRRFAVAPSDMAAARSRADEYLEQVAEDLRAEGLLVETVLEERDGAGKAVGEVARRLDADVIALATHGYKGLKRALMGSVADDILKASPLPLLVQRP